MSVHRCYVIPARAVERLLEETDDAGGRVTAVELLLRETDSVGGRVEVPEWPASDAPTSRTSREA